MAVSTLAWMTTSPEVISHRIQPILLDIAELAPLEQVADRLAAAARELTNAPFAAIGVYGEHGELTRFITSGMSAGDVAAMPHAPRGDGLLGEVGRLSAPLRVDDIGQHPRTSGVPDGHPAMGPYLGVPVMRGDTTIGAFYVTRAPGGASFTAADEQGLLDLAPYASAAMSNAIVHERELRRAECAVEIVRASAELQAKDDERGCAEVLVEAVSRLFPGRHHAVVVLPAQGGGLDGPLVYPAGTELAAKVADAAEMLDRGSHWLEGVIEGEDVLACVTGVAQAAPMVAIACDCVRRPDEVDEMAVMQLADLGAIALSSVRRQAAARAIERYQARDEIARDLHDDLIQSIYSVGLGLQSTQHDRATLEATLDRAVEALGAVIRDLRAYIAQLERGIDGLSRTDLLVDRIVGQLEDDDRIRWTREVALDGTVLEPRRERQIYLIAREAISNVRRHSEARQASVVLRRSGDTLELEVRDDGRGFDRDDVPERSVGLRSMEERVADIGGSMIIESRPGAGTTLRATFPLEPEVAR
jgi:signal transduction histidine kinase